MLANIAFYGVAVIFVAVYLVLCDPSIARLIIGNEIDKSYRNRKTYKNKE